MDGPEPFVLFVLAVFAIGWFSWRHYLKPKLWMWWHVRRYRRLWQAGLHAFESQDYATARDQFQEMLNYQTWEPTEALLSMLGLSLQLLGEYSAALAAFEKAVVIDPASARAMAQLAYFLSTAPDAELRDGPRARELACKACQIMNYASWPAIAILAGAQAECGDFVSAVATYQQALLLMTDAEREIRRSSLEQLQRGEPIRANPEFDRSRVFCVKQN